MRLLEQPKSRAYTKVWPLRQLCTRALQVSYASYFLFDGFTKCSQHRGIRWCYSMESTPTVSFHAVLGGGVSLACASTAEPGVVGSNYAKLLVA